MFQANYKLTNLYYLKDWDVSKIISFNYMFSNTTGLQDASAINNWNIKANANFNKKFNSSPTHPEFTKVSGTWNNNATFVPN